MATNLRKRLSAAVARTSAGRCDGQADDADA